MLQLRGAITALVTPMNSDGNVNYEGFRSLVRFQLEKGIDGLLPLGTTGETPTLTRDEQDRLIQIAVEEAGGKVPVIVGVGTNATSSTVANAVRATELGADCLLVVTPYYNKPSNEGIVRHFQAVAQALDTPILIYNIVGRTGKNIDIATMERLAEIPSVIGVKASSGDIAQICDIIDRISRPRRSSGRPFAVLSGDDAWALALCALGGDGLVSVVSNLVPDRVVALVKASLAGELEAAKELHYGLLPLIRGAFIETNPVPIKQAMDWAGLPAGPVRMPLCELEAANEPKLRAALAASGINL